MSLKTPVYVAGLERGVRPSGVMKRILSLILALCLLLPVFAFAEEELDIEEIYEDVDLDNTEADLDTGEEEGGSSFQTPDTTFTEELQKEMAESLESKD